MFTNNENAARRIRAQRSSSALWIAMTALLATFAATGSLLTTTQLARAETATTATVELSGLVRPNDMNSGALLFPSKELGYFVEAPRLKTDVQIDVSGPIARVKVTQRFQNPSKGWVEGTYVFPLPDDSAVDELRMQIGDRFIEGQIKPREEARQIYEDAKAEGKKAALLEQQRPNIFTNQVANIGPGETIVVQIEYQQAVHQSGGEFSLRFPMVVAPRYNPAPIVQSVEFNGGTGFAVTNDPVENRDKIEPPVLDPENNAKINPVSLTVNLKAGFPLGEVKSPFHDVTLRDADARRRGVVWNARAVRAARDFELPWKAAAGRPPPAGLFRETVAGRDYLMAFVTPPATQQDNAAPAKREVVFVIDNSGSMSGPSIEQARASLALAISNLKAGDRFNVIRFDDTMTDFFQGLVPASADNRERAIAYVRGLTADGGTEMLPALQAALRNQGPVAQGALRQVVFLTDGAIGNEGQLFGEIDGNRGDARVFTVGIGSAPNTHFMTKAAEFGRGTFTHIGSEDQVATRMGELFGKLEHPAMTDIAATFDQAKAENITPNPMPDLYAGEPVVLTAELPQANSAGKLLITGRTGDQPWRVEMSIDQAAAGKGIAKLWARRKIDDLEASGYRVNDPQAIDRQIETVAMTHHLVSRVTSLVAVDVTATRPKNEPLTDTDVPLNLPEGWDFEKVYGEQKPILPSPSGDRDASLPAGTLQQVAMETAEMMAAAPTAKTASLLAKRSVGVNLPQTATPADRHILIGLMMMLIALAAIFWLRLRRASLFRRG